MLTIEAFPQFLGFRLKVQGFCFRVYVFCFLRQPLVKGERLVRYEVNGFRVSGLGVWVEGFEWPGPNRIQEVRTQKGLKATYSAAKFPGILTK